MKKEELIELAKKELKSGKSIKEIEKLLVKANYPDYLVKEIISEITFMKRNNLKYAILGISLLLILSFSIIYLSFDSQSNSSQSVSEEINSDSNFNKDQALASYENCDSYENISPNKFDELDLDKESFIEIIDNGEKCYIFDGVKFLELGLNENLLNQYEVLSTFKSENKRVYITKDLTSFYVFNSGAFSLLNIGGEDLNPISHRIFEDEFMILGDTNNVYIYNILENNFSIVNSVNPLSFREENINFILDLEDEKNYFADNENIYRFESGEFKLEESNFDSLSLIHSTEIGSSEISIFLSGEILYYKSPFEIQEINGVENLDLLFFERFNFSYEKNIAHYILSDNINGYYYDPITGLKIIDKKETYSENDLKILFEENTADRNVLEGQVINIGELTTE